jgi:hypothetical protein
MQALLDWLNSQDVDTPKGALVAIGVIVVGMSGMMGAIWLTMALGLGEIVGGFVALLFMGFLAWALAQTAADAIRGKL